MQRVVFLTATMLLTMVSVAHAEDWTPSEICRCIDNGWSVEFENGTLRSIVAPGNINSGDIHRIAKSTGLRSLEISPEMLSPILLTRDGLLSQLETLRISRVSMNEAAELPIESFHKLMIAPHLQVLEIPGFVITDSSPIEVFPPMGESRIEVLSVGLDAGAQVGVLTRGTSLRSVRLFLYDDPSILTKEDIQALRLQRKLQVVAIECMRPSGDVLPLDTFTGFPELQLLKLRGVNIGSMPIGKLPSMHTLEFSRCASKVSLFDIAACTGAHKLVISEWNRDHFPLTGNLTKGTTEPIHLELRWPRKSDLSELSANTFSVSVTAGNECVSPESDYGPIRPENRWITFNETDSMAVARLTNLHSFALVGDHLESNGDAVANLLSSDSLRSLDLSGANIDTSTFVQHHVASPIVFRKLDLGSILQIPLGLLKQRIGLGTVQIAIPGPVQGNLEQERTSRELARLLPQGLESLSLRFGKFPSTFHCDSFGHFKLTLAELHLENCVLESGAFAEIETSFPSLHRLTLSECEFNAPKEFRNFLRATDIEFIEWLDADVLPHLFDEFPRGTYRIGKSRSFSMSLKM